MTSLDYGGRRRFSATQTLLLTRNDWDMDSDTILSQVPDPQDFFPPPGASMSSRFATPVSDQELKDAQEASVPANTRKQTSWSVNVWKAWCDHHSQLSFETLMENSSCHFSIIGLFKVNNHSVL